MLARVLKTISRYSMLPPGARVIVAVSGGADSVCLLHVLQELFPDRVAGVAHFNHKWRAEASDEDERFVAQLAQPLPFFRAEAVPMPGNREQNARRARLAFFKSLDATVALGHTRDDQAETVLFRFLRGSGLAGLSGIAPTSDGLIRPLLDITRAEIEKYLRERNIPWREDSTNRDLTFARNRIRHELLPQLARNWNPKITDALAHLADLAHEEEQYWQSALNQFKLFQSPGAIELPASLLAACGARTRACRVDTRVAAQPSTPVPLARRLIRRAISLAKGDLRQIDFQHVEAVLNLRRRIHLPGGVTVTRSFDWIRFAASDPQPAPPLQITPPGKFPSPDGQTQIRVDIGPMDAAAVVGNPCDTLSMECSPLELRGWRPGDHYRPQGHSRDQKIQEMFQKARVPSWRRASWPILTCGDKILWARQFGVAEDLAAGGGKRVLRISEVSLS
jgi:tRNA(Ile)-lysidine synthase